MVPSAAGRASWLRRGEGCAASSPPHVLLLPLAQPSPVSSLCPLSCHLQPPGFGYVEFDSADSAADALKGMDQREFQGQKMRVEFAKVSNDREAHAQAQTFLLCVDSS
jgi:hypothetical protein